MKSFQISDALSLPFAAVTERFGFLGQSGGGKTYAAMKLAELMLEAGAQIIALDPVGPWWGLRSSADGKSAGFPISVFGGEHGDVPLTPTSGSLIADVIVDKEISAVLDVSDFTVGEMHSFVIGFAERFFDRKKRKKGPVHLFIEEAHNFLPQDKTPDPKSTLALHRMERIVRVGRNYGVGSSQISQMPQAVSKRTLNQISCCFAFATLGKHERKAIQEWFDRSGGGDLVEELPTLETGTAWMVSPKWLRKTAKVHIAEKTTYDSSETPEFGSKKSGPKVLADVDVAALRESMAVVVQEAEKDDPRPLRKRIAELEAQLKKVPEPKVEQKIVEKQILDAALVVEMRGGIEKTGKLIAGLEATMNSLVAALLRAERIPPPAPVRGPPRVLPKTFPLTRRTNTPGVYMTADRKVHGRTANGHADAEPDDDKPKVTGKAKTILALLKARGVTSGMTRDELAVWSCMAATAGGFNNYIGELKKFGLIAPIGGGSYQITPAGIAFVSSNLGDAQPPTQEEILEEWSRKQTGKAKDILAITVAEYPEQISINAMAERVGMEGSAGGFQNYIGELRSAGLLTRENGQLRATDALFIDVGR